MTLKTPAWNDAKPYGFEWWRLALELGLQEGVYGPTDHKASAAAAGGMRLDVAAGVALVKGDSGTPQTGATQGLYIVVNDATVANAVTLNGSNASLPRIDRIYLRANDSADLGSSSDSSEYFALAGTPTSGATLDNAAGAAATPPDAVRLADVLVPAGSTAVAAGNIRDRRPWARGAALRVVSVPDVSQAAYPSSNVPSPIVSARFEASGLYPVRISYGYRVVNLTQAPTYNVFTRATYDSLSPADQASLGAHVAYAAQGSYVGPFRVETQSVPAAGSHIAQAMAWSDNANAPSAVGGPHILTVEEIIRPNAQN